MSTKLERYKLINLLNDIKDISDTNQNVDFLEQYDAKREFLEISELVDSALNVLEVMS